MGGKQTAHAVAEQKRSATGADRKIVDDDLGVLQQGRPVGNIAAGAVRTAMTAMVGATYRPACLMQALRQQPVSTAMFAQPVHDDDAATCAGQWQQVVRHEQGRAVSC